VSSWAHVPPPPLWGAPCGLEGPLLGFSSPKLRPRSLPSDPADCREPGVVHPLRARWTRGACQLF
jgi:hypothetical protein